MRFEIQYGPAAHQTDYRGSLALAIARCEALVRQGYTVTLRNPDTGFVIQTWNP